MREIKFYCNNKNCPVNELIFLTPDNPGSHQPLCPHCQKKMDKTKEVF